MKVCARGLLVLLLAVASVRAEPLLQPLAGADAALPPAPWRYAGLPTQREPATRYGMAAIDGRRALRIEAESSYGNLVHPLQRPAEGLQLSWSWRVDSFAAGADLRRRDGDDNAVKVCVLFDLPLARVPFVERQLLRLARARSAEALPAATVCYVWDALLPAGSVLPNAYTRRLRYLVLRSGAEPGWRDERRDIAADFRQLFGDEGTEVPEVLAIALGADADNTRGRSLAHVADLVLAR